MCRQLLSMEKRPSHPAARQDGAGRRQSAASDKERDSSRIFGIRARAGFWRRARTGPRARRPRTVRRANTCISAGRIIPPAARSRRELDRPRLDGPQLRRHPHRHEVPRWWRDRRPQRLPDRLTYFGGGHSTPTVRCLTPNSLPAEPFPRFGEAGRNHAIQRSQRPAVWPTPVLEHGVPECSL